MDLIRISDDKLKVILDKRDMQEYALSNENLDYDNEDTRRALWEILDEAKRRLGFNAAENRILVQAYPDKKGGCEIYVTKMEEMDAAEGRERRRSIRGRLSVFSFGDFDTLCAVCKRLSTSPHQYESALYYHRIFYYLFIKERLTDSILPPSRLSPLSFVEEYAKRAKGPLEAAYIKEHGESLLESHAIEKLAPLAAGS
ncbi:MAG: adaptor protein MecA [Clostridia bacterium]|nr:adaptor protein MecA [Clostridia bacterium]MBQ9129742.1 adaptor protein MecA [Clostridia bacterium]